MDKLWSVEVGQSSGEHIVTVPHFFACVSSSSSSYRPQRLKKALICGGKKKGHIIYYIIDVQQHYSNHHNKKARHTGIPLARVDSQLPPAAFDSVGVAKTGGSASNAHTPAACHAHITEATGRVHARSNSSGLA